MLAFSSTLQPKARAPAALLIASAASAPSLALGPGWRPWRRMGQCVGHHTAQDAAPPVTTATWSFKFTRNGMVIVRNALNSFWREIRTAQVNGNATGTSGKLKHARKGHSPARGAQIPGWSAGRLRLGCSNDEFLAATRCDHHHESDSTGWCPHPAQRLARKLFNADIRLEAYHYTMASARPAGEMRLDRRPDFEQRMDRPNWSSLTPRHRDPPKNALFIHDLNNRQPDCYELCHNRLGSPALDRLVHLSNVADCFLKTTRLHAG